MKTCGVCGKQKQESDGSTYNYPDSGCWACYACINAEESAEPAND